MKTVTFESVGDFIAAAKKNGDPHKASHAVNNRDFSGTDTFDEAVELATKGWPEGVRRLSGLRASLDTLVEKAVAAKSKRLHYDVTGDFIDVGKYLGGEPECCGEYVDDSDAQCQTRVIKLVANVSAMAVVSGESIFSAGAAIHAAVDVLESLGHRVELWLGSGSKCNRTSKSLQVLVLIKEAGRAFDADRFAFYLANNASLRRLFFSVEHDLGFNPNTTRTEKLIVPDAIVTPEVSGQDANRQRRIERVLQVCKSAGVSFTQEELQEITA